jgi:hypothetical protein
MLPLDTYIRICEQTGEEPDPEKMPPDRSEFPKEVQDAFLVHDFLPDNWIEGGYLGKNYSALDSILNIFKIEQQEQVLVFLKHIEARNTGKINKELERKRKSSEKPSGTAVPRVQNSGKK